MGTALLPRVYERCWRPLVGRVVKGVTGPSMDEEVRLATELLGLQPGEVVLDFACGTGRFTRTFGDAVGPNGLAIGLDGSVGMLSRALDEPHPPTVASLRAARAISRIVHCGCSLLLRRTAHVHRARAVESCCSPVRAETGNLPDSLTQQEESPAGSERSTAGRSRPACAHAGFHDVQERYFGLAQLVSGRLVNGE